MHRIGICDEKWMYHNIASYIEGLSAPKESAGSVARRTLTTKLTKRCVSAFGGIVGEFCKKSISKAERLSAVQCSNMLIKVRGAIREK